eukprot:2939749-Prymnesium_polylepis.1
MIRVGIALQIALGPTRFLLRFQPAVVRCQLRAVGDTPAASSAYTPCSSPLPASSTSSVPGAATRAAALAMRAIRSALKKPGGRIGLPQQISPSQENMERGPGAT